MPLCPWMCVSVGNMLLCTITFLRWNQMSFLCLVFRALTFLILVERWGLALKWNCPSMAAHADRSGFCLHFFTMLTLKSIWGRSLHQYEMGEVGGRDAIIDFTYYLYVCSAFLDGLALCYSGGVYCCWVFWLAMKSSTSFDVSLSILCSLDLNPLFL